MRILTLAALNASIARAQPLSSPGTGARVVVGAELQAVLKSASIATLDWLAEKGAMQAATVEVLQHVDNNTWLYASYLSQMLATRDQWLPFVGRRNLEPRYLVIPTGIFATALPDTIPVIRRVEVRPWLAFPRHLRHDKSGR